MAGFDDLKKEDTKALSVDSFGGSAGAFGDDVSGIGSTVASGISGIGSAIGHGDADDFPFPSVTNWQHFDPPYLLSRIRDHATHKQRVLHM